MDHTRWAGDGELGDLPPAVHQTIICLDVAGFGDRHPTTMQEVAIRKGMYRTAETAFDRSGVSWADCHVEDRGDGLMILVSASVPKSRLASHTLAQLIAALTEHNQAHDAAEQIELRLAIHAGEVLYDEHGVAGRAVTHTSRLLVLQRHMG